MKTTDNKRRSERILSQAPLVVNGNPAGRSRFVERTRASVVNAHGALISLTAPVTLRQKLCLQNPQSLLKQECSVVYLGEKQGGRAEIGVEFDKAAPQFWGMEKMPESWKAFLPK